MHPHGVSGVKRIGLLEPCSPWLSKIRDGFKDRDKLILSILVLGFYSVWRLAEIQDLQTDPLASKAVRIASTLSAFLLASRVLFFRSAIRLFFRRTIFPILLFFCTCMLSMIVSEWPLLTAYKAVEILIVVMLVMEGTANQRSRPESLLEWLIGLIIAQTCVVWIEGLIFPDLGWSTPSMAKSVNVRMLHGVYPIVNSNTVGFFGGTILVYGLCCLLGGRRQRPMLYTLLVLGGMTILASYSRTSLFAASAAIFFTLIAFRKSGVAGLLLGVLLLAMASASVRTDIIRHVDRGCDSTNLNSFTSNRLELWQESLEHFSPSMILGKGYGVGFRAEGVESNTNAHNSIIELFAGTGLLGVCAWLYMMLNIWVQLVLLRRKRLDSLAYQHVAALALMVYLFVFSLSNTRGVYLDYSTLLLAGIVVYAEKMGGASVSPRPSRVAKVMSSPTWIDGRSDR